MKKNINNMMKTAAAAMLAMTMIGCGSSSASGSASGSAAPAAKTGTNSTYAYLLDTTDLVKPELDLSNADGVLKKVLDNGVLIVATSPDYPAAEWIEEDGTIYGSEMMLAKYIADCLGVDLKIEQVEFSGTFAAVDTGKADCAFSGYGWKKDREEAYEITVGYVGEDNDEETYHTLITTAGNETKYNTLESLVGAHIMAQANSLQEMYCQDQIVALDPNGGTNLEKVGTLDQAILSLAAGKCDAIALDGTTAENYVAQSDGQFALTGIKFDLSLYGDFEGNIGLVKKGETSMINTLNEIIETVKENGYYGEWYLKAKEQSGTAD